MNSKATLLSAVAISVVGFCTITPAYAKANVLFILDGSGSMWQRVDGQPKIVIAKAVLHDALKALPADANVGLMSYGLNRKGDCADIQLLASIAANNVDPIDKLVADLTPKGDTPIAAALMQASNAFKGISGGKNIVLITDGAEECDGDPCAAAKALTAADVNMHIDLVGFNLSDKERQQVQCIADNGNGKYFDAKDAATLTSALSQVATEVEVADAAPAAAAAPPAPTSTVVFSDNFQGDALKPEWTILNPNPDNYAVDGGKLLIVSTAVGGLTEPTLPNIMEYNKPLPDGNWTVTVKFGGVMQTAQERLEIGLRDDEKNYLSAAFRMATGDFYVDAVTDMVKVANGAPPVVQTFDVKQLSSARDVTAGAAPVEPFMLRLTKNGRSYLAAIALNGDVDADGKQIWHSPGEVTSLKPPKNLVIAASQVNPVQGETTFEIQSVTIEQTSP